MNSNITGPHPISLIKSKKRFANHGEVFTPPWLVEKMLDLIKGETERIGSRFWSRTAVAAIFFWKSIWSVDLFLAVHRTIHFTTRRLLFNFLRVRFAGGGGGGGAALRPSPIVLASSDRVAE